MRITNLIVHPYSIRALILDSPRSPISREREREREANRYRYMRITREGLTRDEKNDTGTRSVFGLGDRSLKFVLGTANQREMQIALIYTGPVDRCLARLPTASPDWGGFGARQTCFSIARRALRRSRTSRDSNTTIYGSVTANVAHALVQASILSVEMLSLSSNCFTLVLRANYRD